MKLSITILVVSIILSQCCYSQNAYDSTKISPNVLKIAQKISKHNRVEGVFVGIVGTPSKLYQLGKKLRIKSTRSELEELTFHPSPLVRAYSFWGMAERNETDLLGIVIDHLHDTVKIHTLFADAGDTKKLCDFLIDVIVPKYVFASDYLFTNKKVLSEEEQQILDSVVIFTDNNLEYTGIALTKIKPIDTYYDRIKELANRQNIFAVVALSRYRNNNDTDLIISSFNFPKPDYSYKNSYYYTFWAFSEFPNKSFETVTKNMFDTLVANSDERDLKTFYKAIASFKKPDFLPYLKSSSADLDYYSFIAMTEFTDNLYDSLLFKIWKERRIITKDALDYLSKKDKQRTMDLVKETITAENKYLKIPILKFWINTNYRRTLEQMFDWLYSEDKANALNIINNKLSISEYSELEFYCNKAKNVGDTMVIQPILQRLKTDTEKTYEADSYWYLMEVIVYFNNSRYNEDMIEAILQNKYATKQLSMNRDSLKEDIEFLKSSLIRTKLFDQIELDKYR